MKPPGRIPQIILLLLLTAMESIAASRAAFAALGGGGGAEWYTGPADQSTGIVYGYAGHTLERASFALGALHFEDEQAGRGWGPLLAAAAPLGTALLIRAQATQYFGEHSLRAFRVKVGPEWALPNERTLGVFFTYLENDLGSVVRGGSAEFKVPLRHRWTGRASGGASRLSNAETSAQAALGLAWSPDARFEISAEAGVARNGAFIDVPTPGSGGQPSGGPLGLPLSPGSNESGRRSVETISVARTDPTFSLGLRFALP